MVREIISKYLLNLGVEKAFQSMAPKGKIIKGKNIEIL